jgi:hypothetical protein
VQEGLLDLCFEMKQLIAKRYLQVILGHFFPELTEEEILYGWF